ncbi:MAG: hypothetical protein PHF63_00270 [Herbinix sp.]|nr:hypothetical protein [Herbinix sp.]
MFLVRESVVLEDTAKDVNRIKQKHREAINEAKLMFREAKQCLRDKKKAEGLKKINTAITTFKTVIRETDKVRIEGEDKLFTTIVLLFIPFWALVGVVIPMISTGEYNITKSQFSYYNNATLKKMENLKRDLNGL